MYRVYSVMHAKQEAYSLFNLSSSPFHMWKQPDEGHQAGAPGALGWGSGPGGQTAAKVFHLVLTLWSSEPARTA